MEATERYARQTMLAEIGPEGQLRFSRASVLVVGLGGLGAPVATYLTGAGIGTIGLADNDVVSMTNLQRQVLYTEADFGKPKTECARVRLSALSRHTRFRLHPEGLTAENARQIIAAYDVVVDCCDNYATRYLIDDVCNQLGKPWVHGTIGEFYGQASVFNYKGGPRYRDLFPDAEGLAGMPGQTSGVIGPVPGIIGAVEAAEVMKIIGGYGEPLVGRLFTIDTLTMEAEVFKI